MEIGDIYVKIDGCRTPYEIVEVENIFNSATRAWLTVHKYDTAGSLSQRRSGRVSVVIKAVESDFKFLCKAAKEDELFLDEHGRRCTIVQIERDYLCFTEAMEIRKERIEIEDFYKNIRLGSFKVQGGQVLDANPTSAFLQKAKTKHQFALNVATNKIVSIGDFNDFNLTYSVSDRTSSKPEQKYFANLEKRFRNNEFVIFNEPTYPCRIGMKNTISELIVEDGPELDKLEFYNDLHSGLVSLVPPVNRMEMAFKHGILSHDDSVRTGIDWGSAERDVVAEMYRPAAIKQALDDGRIFFHTNASNAIGEISHVRRNSGGLKFEAKLSEESVTKMKNFTSNKELRAKLGLDANIATSEAISVNDAKNSLVKRAKKRSFKARSGEKEPIKLKTANVKRTAAHEFIFKLPLQKTREKDNVSVKATVTELTKMKV